MIATRFLKRMTMALFSLSIYGSAAVPYTVDERLLCDLRLLADQAFHPLHQFMSQEDYQSVITRGRLASGALFTIPIVLDVPVDVAEKALKEGEVLLQDEKLNPLALCKVNECYTPDLEKECMSTFGTLSMKHPGVRNVMAKKGKVYLSADIHPYPYLSQLNREEGVLTPQETRALFEENGWNKIVAFQTRNPLHFAHIALIKASLKKAGSDAALFMHPVIGPTQAEDIPPRFRRKCYEAILPEFAPHEVKLAYLPLAMRMAGPKEAMMHALIRRNYGATHFIIGRDHAGPSAKNDEGKSFYGPYEAQEFVKKHANELGLTILTNEEMVYAEELSEYVPISQSSQYTTFNISGTEVRRRLTYSEEIPSWFSPPKVIEILRHYYQQRNGLCIYLVGLSGAGKSTLATALKRELENSDSLQREVIILDGDVMRKYLSSGLGFSKKDRSINVRRIGYVASLIAKTGGISICANIAPYEEDRQANRELISNAGTYFEVYVDTPLEVCEQRDVKGLYKLAREGKIQEFTGISDPFEFPINADCIVSGADTIENCVQTIISKLKEKQSVLK